MQQISKPAGLFFEVAITGLRSLLRKPQVKRVPAQVRLGHYYTQGATHWIAGPFRLCVVWANPRMRDRAGVE